MSFLSFCWPWRWAVIGKGRVTVPLPPIFIKTGFFNQKATFDVTSEVVF
jgi:hypothetical protein